MKNWDIKIFLENAGRIVLTFMLMISFIPAGMVLTILSFSYSWLRGENMSRMSMHVFNQALVRLDEMLNRVAILNESLEKKLRGRTYQRTWNADKEAGIRCLICRRTSYSRDDIDYKYCGNCNIYHEDPFDIKFNTIRQQEKDIHERKS